MAVKHQENRCFCIVIMIMYLWQTRGPYHKYNRITQRAQKLL